MMISSVWGLRRVSVWGCALLIGFGMNAVAAAEGLEYVMVQGDVLTMERSTTELGIVLNKARSTASLGSKLQGQWVDFSTDPTCPVKILKVPDANAVTRTKALSDSSIREVHPVYRFSTSPHPVIGTGTLLTKVRPGMSVAALNALFAEHHVTVVEAVAGQSDVYLLAPLGDPDESVALAAGLARDARTEWAQPNFRSPVRTFQLAPADAFFNFQWHHNNTGQFGGKPDADIDSLEAWSVADGQDIRFGMFDDSADFTHEDLRDGYIGIGHDPTAPSNDTSEFEDPSPKSLGDNHGTRVLGLAVARANSVGGRGVAFQAQWTASRGLNAALTDAQQASVYTFAIQQDVDVHINSWGFLPGIPTPAVVRDAIRRAYASGRNKGDLNNDDEDDPLGMVIVFASGNDRLENRDGFEISTLPEVLAVGASTDEDTRSSFSNFGDSLDILAPSGGDATAAIFTTDNSDREGSPDFGANKGGTNSENPFIGPIQEPDPTGNYTAFFSGTSASCPIAAGVAGLVLSVNPLLTVPEVRMVLTHTADQIDAEIAKYDGITSHSLTHAYGRINAKAAVDAAAASLVNGGFTWPVPAAFVNVQAGTVRFRQNDGTNQFIIVTSDAPFSFIPIDGTCYDKAQEGCDPQTGEVAIEPLPNGVSVVGVGCNWRCGAAPSNQNCLKAGDEQCFSFDTDGTRYFAIYGFNNIGRYSFGVSVDSNGNVSGAEDLIRGVDISGGSGGSIGGGGTLPNQGPAVTILASPLEGDSPLTVRFTGNAVSAIAIDETRTQWDFDTSDGVLVDSTQRNTTHTYSVPDGETRNFVARLTMFDVNGNVGFEQVSIQVKGKPSGAGGGAVGSEDLRIIISIPGSPGSDVTEGTSPFDVLMNVDAGAVVGTVQSIVWDLGDGTRLTGLTVPHTYINESETTVRLPITATVTTRNTAGATATNTTTKLITILPGTATVDTGQPNLDGTGVPGVGGGAAPCGTVGMIPLMGLVFSLSLLRRRRGYARCGGGVGRG